MTRASEGRVHALLESARQAASPGPGGPAPTPDGAERVLLADFLACVRAGGQAPAGWTADGTSGAAGALALRSHARDLDDIHWGTRTHIGSVVWPVALSVGAEAGCPGPTVAGAVRLGYQVTADLARHLGPEHAVDWHVTATAGVVGAAAVAATVLGLDRDGVARACGHAAAVAGGTGQAMVERSATAGFHRAAAAVVGIQAARLAESGAEPSAHVIEGPSGMVELLAGGAWSAVDTARGAAIEETAVRLYPTNGFAQAAVALTARLRRDTGDVAGGCGTPSEIVVDVPELVAAATTGDVGGLWWNLRAAVAAAWSSGDPFRLERTAASELLEPRVVVVTDTATPGTTRVTIRTTAGVLSRATDGPTGRLDDPGLTPLLRRKWTRLAERPDVAAAPAVEHVDEVPGRDVLDVARAILTEGIGPDDLTTLLAPTSTGRPVPSSPTREEDDRGRA